MNRKICAVYEDGVFKPFEPLDLKEHARVEITISPATMTEPEEDAESDDDPLAGLRVDTGIPDLAENFDDYRFGRRQQ